MYLLKSMICLAKFIVYQALENFTVTHSVHANCMYTVHSVHEYNKEQQSINEYNTIQGVSKH